MNYSRDPNFYLFRYGGLIQVLYMGIYFLLSHSTDLHIIWRLIILISSYVLGHKLILKLFSSFLTLRKIKNWCLNSVYVFFQSLMFFLYQHQLLSKEYFSGFCISIMVIHILLIFTINRESKVIK